MTTQKTEEPVFDMRDFIALKGLTLQMAGDVAGLLDDAGKNADAASLRVAEGRAYEVRTSRLVDNEIALTKSSENCQTYGTHSSWNYDPSRPTTASAIQPQMEGDALARRFSAVPVGAEPVGWQWREGGDLDWYVTNDANFADYLSSRTKFEVCPLYAAALVARPSDQPKGSGVGTADIINSASATEQTVGADDGCMLYHLGAGDPPCVKCGAEPCPKRTAESLTFIYRNHAGVVATRRVHPISIRYGTTEWHPEPGWLLRAWDFGKQTEREFAMADIGVGTEKAGMLRAAGIAQDDDGSTADAEAREESGR